MLYKRIPLANRKLIVTNISQIFSAFDKLLGYEKEILVSTFEFVLTDITDKDKIEKGKLYQQTNMVFDGYARLISSDNDLFIYIRDII